MAHYEFLEWLNEFFSSKRFEFEWDEGNKYKNEVKHRLTWVEIEQAFDDEYWVPLGIQVTPAVMENRYGFFGRTINGKIIFVCFTIRSERVRVISAREVNKTERIIYEK